MDLLELNDILLNNRKHSEKSVATFTDEEYKQFNELINANGVISRMFNSIDCDKAFFSAYPDIKSMFGNSASELFYATKLGVDYKGVPNRLVYIVQALFVLFGNTCPNKAINSAISLIKPYANYKYKVDDEYINTKGVIDSILGYKSKLITTASRRSKTRAGSEIYISNVKKVAIVPNDIMDCISDSAIDTIEFNNKLGLVTDDVPLRIMCGRIGITVSDLNLTETV